ncbi:MAG: hypothetical protein QOG15_755 [Solirubrobacteraceae bacterium]|nr:hypothetical protein [Solirubrobacteraceae bacterium]
MKQRLATLLKVLGAFGGAALVGFGGTYALSGGAAERDSPASGPSAEKTVRVQVISAVLQRAHTARGRSRDRARLSVHVRVTNHGTSHLRDVNPALISVELVRPDPRARDTTGSLLRPIAPGETAGGRLRFETAGAVTRQLTSTLRARLRIAGRTFATGVEIGDLAN